MSYRSVAVKAAKEAGKILREGFEGTVEVSSKATHDVVTDVDVKSEKRIIEIIKAAFPDHSIRAEESGTERKNSDYLWIIDPLDGTANFVIGSPFFSVSIALAYRGKVIVGVIYNPILKYLYYAEEGKGAFFNGKRVHVSDRDTLSESFIVSGDLYDDKEIDRSLATTKNLIKNSKKTLIIFSPAMNLCNLARGKIDGFIDVETTPEDHAAGSLIASEAGAIVHNYYSKNWDANKIGIIATNGRIHKELLKLIV